MPNREMDDIKLVSKKIARKVPELLLILICLYVTLTSIRFVIFLYTTPNPKSFHTKKIYIEKGTPFRDVVDSLYEEEVITSKAFFTLLAHITLSTKKIKAGEYIIPAPQKPMFLLRKFVSGLVAKYYITIPEGSNIYNISTLLERYKITSGERFLALAGSKEVAKNYGIDSRSLEGYLFPDTYVLTRGMDEKSIISLMVQRFKKAYTEEMDRKRREIGMTLDELITISSIIEKETSLDREKPIISSIIYRRLKKNMRLQMDPTVIYGLKKWEGKLTKRDLNENNEFNSYLNKGLPPGPISNPGLSSIKAAIWPADTKYLYFVSKNDGTHHFSQTLREHINAVNRYQKFNRRKKKGN